MVFDPERILREVRAAASIAGPAKAARMANCEGAISQLANLAAHACVKTETIEAAAAAANGALDLAKVANRLKRDTAEVAYDAANTAKRLNGVTNFSQIGTFSHFADLEAEIQERAGMAADSVPEIYLDAWARLQCVKPTGVVEAHWQVAINDAGLFLDGWSKFAPGLGWTASELFEATTGLAWQLRGAFVQALGADHARLSDGRILEKQVQK